MGGMGSVMINAPPHHSLPRTPREGTTKGHHQCSPNPLPLPLPKASSPKKPRGKGQCCGRWGRQVGFSTSQ